MLQELPADTGLGFVLVQHLDPQIPPVTGNGMSMAFESAELAIEALAQFSNGERSWRQAQVDIAAICDRQFAPRLRWAALWRSP